VINISIVLPTFNRLDVIGRAVASILRQSHQEWELIVVDDGSTDGTRDRIESLDPRIRYIEQANQGVYVARNTGLRAARGRFVTFMDSDDEWLPHFLALTTAFLNAHPDRHWVTTEFVEDLGDGSPLFFMIGMTSAFCMTGLPGRFVRVPCCCRRA
jgi:glycosyltransferase involved in cell wall biosynthesis